jgi:hypothetical protein
MPSMRFVTRSDASSRLEGKRVAIVGSGPGVLDNAPGFVDGHDVVVRVNNYKLSAPTGFRTDVHYSFYGASIVKTAEDLKRDGVTLCWAKCPNDHAIDSEWHRINGKMMGVDFRWIYQRRASFWFCDTFVPSKEEFLKVFELLDRHVPTTGFAAILEVLSCEPREVFLTGFDGFSSGIHNVNEPWQKKNPEDPIGHVPERELAWLAANWMHYPIVCDAKLTQVLEAALRGPFRRPAGRLARTS